MTTHKGFRGVAHLANWKEDAEMIEIFVFAGTILGAQAASSRKIIIRYIVRRGERAP